MYVNKFAFTITIPDIILIENILTKFTITKLIKTLLKMLFVITSFVISINVKNHGKFPSKFWSPLLGWSKSYLLFDHKAHFLYFLAYPLIVDKWVRLDLFHLWASGCLF